jgi:hypothetical protein
MTRAEFLARFPHASEACIRANCTDAITRQPAAAPVAVAGVREPARVSIADPRHLPVKAKGTLCHESSARHRRASANAAALVSATTGKRKPRCDIGVKRPRQFKNCLTCGKLFHAPISHNRKYCSPDCAYKRTDPTTWPQPKERGTAICGKCGKEFQITRRSPRGLFCSVHCACAKNSNGVHGWREIGGQRIYARSRWEANYARYLEWQRAQGLLISWEHEPETFWFEGIKRGVCSYLPDFKVVTQTCVAYHEVKGWMDRKSATKLKRMAKYHPAVKIELIDATRYRAIAAQMKSIINGWEKTK